MASSENHFQVIVLGTGLVESIAAAALAKAGFSVAHLDRAAYYGAGQASLTPAELIAWADAHTASDAYTRIACARDLPPRAAQYVLSLAPAVVPAVGTLIGALIRSGVARYGEYKLVERTGIYVPGGAVRVVPGGKEDVFRSKDLSLLDKRRLMRFLLFAAGEFEGAPELSGKQDTPFLVFLRDAFALPEQVAQTIAFALAFRVSADDKTLDALQQIRIVLRSSGRYGPSPFLVAHYGGAGEITQGFCRAAAVHGAVYALGHDILSVAPASGDVDQDGVFELDVRDFPDRITCDVVLSAADLLPDALRAVAQAVPAPGNMGASQSAVLARGIVLLDNGVYFDPPGAAPADAEQADSEPLESEASSEETDTCGTPARKPVDTAILVFPPGSVTGGSASVAATAFIAGEASMSTPAGKWIAYLALPVPDLADASAEALLQPYLTALLQLTTTPPSPTPVAPTFTTFYIEHAPAAPFSAAPAHTPRADAEAAGAAPARVLVAPAPSGLLAAASESAAAGGEALFWAAVAALRTRGLKPAASRAGADTSAGTGTEHSASKVDDVPDAEVDAEGFPLTMWPSLEAVADDDGGW